MDGLKDQVEYVIAPREQVMIIDKIVELVKDSQGVVETSNHWKAISLMFDLFRKEFPAHYDAFVEEIKQYRLATASNKGIIKDDAGDSIQHQMEIPERFFQYVRAIFPDQKWDREFLKKLAQELPIFKVTEKF